VPWSPPTNPSAPLPSPSPPPATPAAATQPAGSSSSGSRAPSQAAQNASVNRLRDHSGRLESSRRPPGAFKAAVTHPANSATTFSGALDPLDKVCGHLFRRLEADRRAKGLAGPPDPTGPGLGTPRIYIRIPVTTTTTSGGRPRRSIRRSRASRRRSPRKRRGARRSWRKSRSRPRRRPRRRPAEQVALVELERLAMEAAQKVAESKATLVTAFGVALPNRRRPSKRCHPCGKRRAPSWSNRWSLPLRLWKTEKQLQDLSSSSASSLGGCSRIKIAEALSLPSPFRGLRESGTMRQRSAR